jgi:lysyl-tRNA synthetase class 2
VWTREPENISRGSRDNTSMREDVWTLSKRRGALWVRARMIQAIRRFFIERDYLEVETPCRIPALIPEAHIDAVVCGDWFLQPSPELCMKRLLAAGFDKIFQICRCFREGERGSRHLPEFTMLEWYRRDITYMSLMLECQDLITSVSSVVGCGSDIVYQGNKISLHVPWERLSVKEAFARYASVSMNEAVREGSFDEIMVCDIEPNLGKKRPTFLCDYPISLGALARRKEVDPAVAERFELYMAGIELANAFSELIDVNEQQLRFQNVQEHRSSTGKSVYPVSERFLRAFDTMPESAGIALGVDRMAMIFSDSTDIDDVVAFSPELL